MGLWDIIIGGQPKEWSDEQWETFKTQYGNMVSGSFSWMDFLPPTNLPGAGIKMASMSVKLMFDRGEMGKFASWVTYLNGRINEGYPLNTIKSDMCLKLEGKSLVKNTEQLFYSIAALHMAVYGYLKKP